MPGGGMRAAWDGVIEHSWTLPVCGVVAAVSLGALVNQILALRLDMKFLPSLPEVSAPAGPASNAPQMSPGGFVPLAARTAPVVSIPVSSPSGAPAKSSLPIDLLGTMFVTDRMKEIPRSPWMGGSGMTFRDQRPGLKSVALLQLTTGSRDIDAVHVGEKWQGIELLAVERNRVLVRNMSTGAQEYITSDALQGAGPVSRTGRPSSNSSAASGKIILSRSEVNRAIDNNSNVIFSWADVQPYAAAGEVQGFQLSNIKPRGKPFFNLLGFREGDIIKRVNGVKMDSVDKAVGLWQEIHGKDQVTFSIQRQGVDQEINIGFKP